MNFQFSKPYSDDPFLDARTLRPLPEPEDVPDEESLIDAHELIKRSNEEEDDEDEPEEEEFKPTADCYGEITCDAVFNRQVRYLNSLEKRYKELQCECKELRPSIADLKNRVSVYMKGPLSEARKKPVEKINIKDSNIRYNLKKSKRTISSFSKKELPNSLTRYFVEKEKISEDEALKKADDIMEFCKSICKKFEKVTLTRKEL